MTKEELEKELKELSAKYPALTDIDLKLAKKDIVRQAKEVIQRADEAAEAEEAVVDRKALFQRLLKEVPTARLVPVTAPVIRLENPAHPQMTFELRALDPQTTNRLLPLDRFFRHWRTPEDQQPMPASEKVASTSIQDVPGWAQEKVIELVEDGTLRVFTSPEEAENYEVSPVTNTGPILDNVTGTLSMSLVYPKNTGGKVERPVIEPVGLFTTPEQEAAWNTLCGFVEGEGPLPDRPEDISTDPKAITKEEYLHVQSRIERCLEHPEAYTSKETSKKLFDVRTYFNQLLQIEWEGFTPSRPGAANKKGGTRPKILRLIRTLAKDNGLEVMGQYVVTRQERGQLAAHQFLPQENFTQNRQAKPRFNAHIGSKPSEF